MTYWDTSALLKLYVAEPDSHVFDNLVLTSGSLLVTSDLTRVELLCALHRKEQVGDLGPGAASRLYARFLAEVAAGQIQAVAASAEVLLQAERLISAAYAACPPIMVRSLDVVQVASALVRGARIVVATDMRLRGLATVAGLRTLP